VVEWGSASQSWAFGVSLFARTVDPALPLILQLYRIFGPYVVSSCISSPSFIASYSFDHRIALTAHTHMFVI
jgi:hypothetical protein